MLYLSKMNLLVILFVLKLYTKINIFKNTQKKYGQVTIKLAKKMENQL